MTSSRIGPALEALRAGGIVCYPTETFYGLGVDAKNPAAVAKLVAAKGRGQDAIAVIVPDLDAARGLWSVVPAVAEELARRHWPGPLTLVLPARPDLPAPLLGSTGGIGARVSSHPVARVFVQAFGGAITATSANLTGCEPATTPEQAQAQLGGAIDLVLDAGPTAGGLASTVVDISAAGLVRVLRQGAVVI